MKAGRQHGWKWGDQSGGSGCKAAEAVMVVSGRLQTGGSIRGPLGGD